MQGNALLETFALPEKLQHLFTSEFRFYTLGGEREFCTLFGNRALCDHQDAAVTLIKLHGSALSES